MLLIILNGPIGFSVSIFLIFNFVKIFFDILKMFCDVSKYIVVQCYTYNTSI